MPKTSKHHQSSNETFPYKQKYCAAWEKHLKLAGWLTLDTNSGNAYCKVCRSTLQPHKAGLLKHADSSKHKDFTERERIGKSCKPIPFKSLSIRGQHEAELKLAIFVAEHTSVTSIDHLGQLLRTLDPNSNILSNLKLHHTKCTMVIKNVLFPSMLQELIRDIDSSPISLVIDERTDISTTKVLCCMIRYFSKAKRDLITFYRLIKVEDATAESMFESIKRQLQLDGLKIEHVVGIGCNSASVMVGRNNSVAAFFKKAVPDLIVVKCVCHSLHLCAEKAFQSLPGKLDFLIREAPNWFSYSSKRQHEFQQIFAVMNNGKTPLKIAGCSGTRWLSRYNAICSILDQWNELHLLFRLARDKDRCHAAEQLCNIMQCGAYKAYMYFLKHVLKDVNATNAVFQSENVESVKLFEDLMLLYKSILKNIVVPACLEKISDKDLVSYEFHTSLMHPSAVYCGYEFDMIAISLPPEEVIDIKTRCRDFYLELATQIKCRLPENLNILQQMCILQPQIATLQTVL